MAITVTTPIAVLHPVRNQMPLGMSADPSWQTYDTYYIILDIEIEEVYDSGTFVAQNINQRLYPNSSGNILLSIHSLLKGIFGHDRPLWSNNTLGSCSGILRRYKYVLTDYGNSAQLSTQTSTAHTVLNAGMNHQSFQDLPLWIAAGKFLTHQPRIKLVRPWQPEWLFYALKNTDTFRLQVELVHEDTSTTIWEPPSMSITGDYGEIAIFPVGYEQLNIESQGTDIVGWKVSILDSSDNVDSEVMEYQIDPMMSDLDRYYFFENSFGGWDTFRTTGKLSIHNFETAALVGVKTLPINYDVRDGNYFREQVENHETFTQATGLGSGPDSLTWAKDLLRAKKIHRISGFAPNLDASQTSVLDMPEILIQTGRASLPQDEEYEYGIEFSYRESFVNHGI